MHENPLATSFYAHEAGKWLGQATADQIIHNQEAYKA